MDCEISVSRRIPITQDESATESDKATARAICMGDTSAWDEFFDRYSSWVYRFAYHHLGGNHADAEDLCSDILMAAAGSIKTYDATRGSLDVWLLGVSRHRLARFCRRRRNEVPLIPEVLDTIPAHEGESMGVLTDEMLTRDAVNRALYSLPERQASALVGKYVDGYSIEELARLSRTTPKAIESLLSRARAAFRSALGELHQDSSGGDRIGTE
jgi:RNA polymerase sigma-70 factor (ECF subfamily)